MHEVVWSHLREFGARHELLVCSGGVGDGVLFHAVELVDIGVGHSSWTNRPDEDGHGKCVCRESYRERTRRNVGRTLRTVD